MVPKYVRYEIICFALSQNYPDDNNDDGDEYSGCRGAAVGWAPIQGLTLIPRDQIAHACDEDEDRSQNIMIIMFAFTKVRTDWPDNKNEINMVM